jgi:hypothetical protein
MARHGPSKGSKQHGEISRVQHLLPATVAVGPREAEVVQHIILYMLSGGQGSLGLLMAEWLASMEASALWLLGCSGHVSDPQDKVVQRICRMS